MRHVRIVGSALRVIECASWTDLLQRKAGSAYFCTEHSQVNAEKYFCGACLISDMLCLGTSNGGIVVCSCTFPPVDDERNTPIIVHRADLFGAHETAITCLVSETADSASQTMASADITGRIVIWDMEGVTPLLSTGGDLPMFVLSTMESACTSVVLCGGIVAVATASGLISMYHADTKEKLAEIAAHARCINALAVDATGTLMASVGDDSRVFVWRFPGGSTRDDAEPMAQWCRLVFSATVTDKLLTGVVFDPLEGHLAVTAYDSNELLVFPFKGL
eukprot:m.1334909 g.1334909  ORF g.1334909 m.1334909 type:complete len:277 (+) comp24877_c0_seq7:162-992(+)